MEHPLGTRGRADLYWNSTVTHHITEDYTVPVGTTLHIEPGATIVFESHHTIFVEGSLLVEGTVGEPILFTSGREYMKPGDWGSIQFNASSGATGSISHAIIEYAEVGIRCEGSSPSIQNSDITRTLLSGIYAINSNSAIENNSIIDNTGNGIHLVSSSSLSYGNTISDNGFDGVIAHSSSSLILAANSILSNGYDGVHIDGSDIIMINNEVSYNERNGAILDMSLNAVLDTNRITNNSWHGLRSIQSQSQVKRNIVTDNGISSDFSGIGMFDSNSQIIENHIARNAGDAIRFEKSSGEILNNSLAQSNAGISLWRSSPMISHNNPIENNKYGIYVMESSPIIDGNMLVDNAFGVYSVDSPDVVICDNVITNSFGKDIVVGNEEGNVILFSGTDGPHFETLGSLRTTDQSKIDVDSSAFPTTVDMDADGWLDLVIGNEQGYFHYYRNTGDGYEYMGMLSNITPLIDLDVGTYSHPFVIDWDSDGDLDLLVGQGDGRISYFKNDGSNTFSFQKLLPAVDVYSMAAPFLVGWVGVNPPIDLLAGSGDGKVISYLGSGDTYFSYLNPLRNTTYKDIDVGSNSSAILTHWDNDTQWDLIIGGGQGNLSYYEERIGSSFEFEGPVTLTNGSNLSISGNSVPALKDWNRDGYLDFILGGDGFVYYCENAGNNTFRAPVNLLEGATNLSVGNWSAPYVVDWDDDGIFDLVVGDTDGYLTLFLGQDTGSVALGPGQRIQIRGPPTYISVGGWSAPAMLDWNSDGDPDLITGGTDGMLSYYENVGSNEFIFQWNLSNGVSDVDVGFRSAPRIVDWDDDGIDDLLVGSLDGYVHRFERIPGDPQNIVDLGLLDADGSQIQVGQRSAPCTIDLEEDGDLDLLVGDDSGEVHWYERVSDQLFNRGKLKTNGQDLSVDGFSAPLARGWESSSRNNAEHNGLYFENTTALVVGNEVIRGGGGGYAVYASDSSISIDENDWVAGGKGLYGGGTSSKSSSGGHGILASNSSLFISNTNVRGGDGSDSSTQKLEGGDGGIGIEVENVTLEILNSSVIGGSGRRGVLTSGVDGVGLQLRSSRDAFLDSSSVSGRTAFLVSDSSIYVRNGIVASEQYDFDLGNASSAISMNTTFDKSSVIFQDTMSTLAVGWHLHARVLDVLSLPVPRTELKILPATFTTQGDLYLGSSITGPASPTIAHLSSATDPDLLIGDMNGNIQFYVWNGSQFLYNGTVNLSAGGPIAVNGPCSPHFADWEGDGDLDLFLGNESGKILLFNNTGNGTFDMGWPVNHTGGAPINTSSEIEPFIVDWDGDGELDIIAGGDGYIYYFENDGNGYFLPGKRLEADGAEIKRGSWSSPEVLDFDGDGRLDLLVGSQDGHVVLYLNDSFDQLAFGGYLKSNNSILHDIDVEGRSVPTVTDLDGDGYPDLLAGNLYGEVKWFRSNRYSGDVITYTDDGGTATNTPVIEYTQMDSNGDNDGEDDGERFYLSPSGILASGCGMTGNVAPLPHVMGSILVTVHLNVSQGNCPPIVQSTDPFQNQDNVPVKSGITIAFDKDMNKITVEGSLFFNPPLTISTDWPTTSEVVLDVGTMDFGEDYTLTVSGTAQDFLFRGLDGNYNGASEGSPVDDFTLMFRTEEIPQVISHNPKGSGQPVDSIISLCFNKPMNASSVVEFLSLSPAVDFWEWWSTNGSCLYLDAELEPGTTYTVSVSGDATDRNGNTLDGNENGVPQGGFADRFEWQFSTAADSSPPRVVSTYPVSGQNNVDLHPTIIVNFSEPIDFDTLETGLTISSNGFVWGQGSGPGFIPVLDFGAMELSGSSLTVSDVSLQYDSTYSITLSGDFSTGISDIGGNALDGNGNGVSEGSPIDDYAFNFTTIDPIPPRVVFTSPSDGEIGVPLTPIIRAIFDEKMDATSLDNFNVSLTDSAGGEIASVISYLSGNNTLMITPVSLLNYSSNYTVTISSMVRDISYNLLDGNKDGIGSGTSSDDYAWTFTSIPDTSSPIVNIISPPSGTIFIVDDEIEIYGNATDSDRIEKLEMSIHLGDWIDITDFFVTEDNWSYIWDTEDLDEGLYAIEVRGTDPAGLDSTDQIVIELKKPVSPYPFWIPILLTIVILIGGTISYRYFRSTHAKREMATEQRRTEMEEMLRRIEQEQESLVARAKEVEEKEMDLDAREEYLRELDKEYASVAASLMEEKKIDLSMGERIIEEEMGEDAYEIKRYEKAFTLLSEAEASEAGEITRKLPESGKKAMLLVYFNAVEAYLRDRMQEMIPPGATILLGEKGHINTRTRNWEEKWSMLSLGTLTHAIDHNKHFFVEDEEAWEEVKDFLRETVEIRNLTAHPSEANPDVIDVRKRVYSAIMSLSNVLRRPREIKK